MVSDAERAFHEWETLINPAPIGGDVLFMLYFKHKKHPFKFHHDSFKSLYEARKAEKPILADLQALRSDQFMEKYRIGYDLRGTIL
jgi:hypothetical protein